MFINRNSNLIPVFIRASFHDLLNFNRATGSGGAHGCLVDSAIIAGFTENNGLSRTADLVNAVRARFGRNTFSTGDIISLAGKVSMETLFPCMSLEWGSGRTLCSDSPLELESGPSPSISSLSEFKKFSDRYGLTPEEFAILTTGAHAISNASNRKQDTGITSFMFTRTTSAIDFIQEMIDDNNQWRFLGGTWFELDKGGQVETTTIGRFPSDFFMFPSVIRGISSSVTRDTNAARLETLLRDFADDNKSGASRFNNAFAAAFEKMLKIGSSNLKPFSSSNNQC